MIVSTELEIDADTYTIIVISTAQEISYVSRWLVKIIFGAQFILDNFYLIGKDKGDIYQNIKYGHEHKYSSDGVSLSKLFILFEATVSRKSWLSLLYFLFAFE